jgi:hypothetical protein
MKRTVRQLLAGGAAAAVLAGGLAAVPAHAVSDHNEYYYGGGRYLQANAWMQNSSGTKFGWTTSAKYLGSGRGPSTASYIKNTAKIWVNGIGVSLGNASGATTSDKDYGTSWTNYNTWISDRAGSNSVSNLFYLNINETSGAVANVPYFGSPRSSAITITKWV